MIELPDLTDLSALDDAPPGRGRPVVVHFLAPLTVPIDRFHSRVMKWGEELQVTDEVRAAGLDRFGASWLDLLGNPEGQRARWGREVFAEGTWPAGLSRLEPGSLDHSEAREVARQSAWQIGDPRVRAGALAEVTKDFGPIPRANTTILEWGVGDGN